MLAHTGQHSAAETIELTRHAEAAGADFAVVINPYYPPASDEGLYQWFAHVCGSVDIGVWLFDTGYRGWPVHRADPAAGRARERVRHQGGPRPRPVHGTAGGGGRHDPGLLAPRGDLAGEHAYHGQRVYMSSAAPYLYQTPGWQPMREYTRLALGGDIAGAEKAAATLDPVRAVAGKWLQGRPA